MPPLNLSENDICFIDSSIPHSGISKSDNLEYAMVQLKLETLKNLSQISESFMKLVEHEINIQNNFKSEEDFVISSKPLAEYTQSDALQNFKSLMDKFVYNYHVV